MTRHRTETQRIDVQIRGWMQSEAEAPASTRLFEQVIETTRTMPQLRRRPAWWPFESGSGEADHRTTARLLVLVAIGLVAALGAVVITGGGRAFLSIVRPAPTMVGRAAERFVDTCAHPMSIATVGGEVWVSCIDQVRWFDANGKVQGAVSGTALAVDAEGGWLSTGDQVTSIDAGGALGPVVTAPNTVAIALDADSAWAVDATDERVVRIDRATRAVIATIPLSSRPSAVVASAGRIWLILPDIGRVAVVDPASNSVIDLVPVAHPAAIVAAFNSIWVASTGPVVVTRIDTSTLRADGHPIAALSASSPDAARGTAAVISIADVNGSVWVAMNADLVELDPDTVAATRVVQVLAPDPVPIGSIAGLDGRLLLIDPTHDRVLSLSP